MNQTDLSAMRTLSLAAASMPGFKSFCLDEGVSRVTVLWMERAAKTSLPSLNMGKAKAAASRPYSS